MELWPAILGNVIARSPLYLAWLVAMVFAILRWREHPRVSMVALVSLASLATITTVHLSLSPWLPFALRTRGMNVYAIGQVLTMVAVGTSLLEAACWAGIAYAIFAGRRTRV